MHGPLCLLNWIACLALVPLRMSFLRRFCSNWRVRCSLTGNILTYSISLSSSSTSSSWTVAFLPTQSEMKLLLQVCVCVCFKTPTTKKVRRATTQTLRLFQVTLPSDFIEMIRQFPTHKIAETLPHAMEQQRRYRYTCSHSLDQSVGKTRRRPRHKITSQIGTVWRTKHNNNKIKYISIGCNWRITS